MGKESLRICVMGCGGYASTVMTETKGLSGVEFSFASRDFVRAESYRSKFSGVKAYGSYEEALADDDNDAVYIFSPHDLHLGHAEMAATAGKHVLVEKPIARTIEEGQLMIECARSNGVNLMVAENYRFIPALDKALDVMQSDEENGIGQLRSIRIICEGYSEPTEWRRSILRTGGGVFIDGGIHFVNLLISLGGFPERISATWLPKVFERSEGEDGISLLARLPKGVSGTILFSRATNISETRQHVTIDGGRGRLTFIPYGNEVILEKGAIRRKIRTSKSYRGTRKMVKEFRKSIIENRKPVMSGEKGLDDLSIVLASYQSAGSVMEVTPRQYSL